MAFQAEVAELLQVAADTGPNTGEVMSRSTNIWATIMAVPVGTTYAMACLC